MNTNQVQHTYQIYMLKIDTLLYNTEFSKEFPSEYKKLISESLTKSVVKLLKDSMVLGKYIDYAHERCISNLKTLINSYELNYKAIHSSKKRIIHKNYSNDKFSETFGIALSDKVVSKKDKLSWLSLVEQPKGKKKAALTKSDVNRLWLIRDHLNKFIPTED